MKLKSMNEFLNNLVRCLQLPAYDIPDSAQLRAAELPFQRATPEMKPI
jgi:hypothetical protein